MRIELDDIQDLALTACTHNTNTTIEKALKKDVKAKKLIAKSKAMRIAAVKIMDSCFARIASAHGLESIPSHAEMKKVDGRMVFTWPDPKPKVEKPEAPEVIPPKGNTRIPEERRPEVDAAAELEASLKETHKACEKTASA